MSINHARQIARSCDVNVLLYNPRGVGLSLGTEFTLDEAVEDGKAAIKYALNNLCDNNSKRLGVCGISLGGGISATALSELQDEKVIDKIALYVNYRSFPSLQHYVKSILNIPTMITRLALAILRINPLNTGNILTKKTLADETVVITAECDEIMEGVGRLEIYLKESQILHTNQIQYVSERGAYHNHPVNIEIFKRKSM